MRLIDADKLRQKDMNGDLVDIFDVLEAPIVKAIPVEWIKDYIIPFQVYHDSLNEERKENDAAGWVVDVLEGMLKKWEKENE